jgi:hypothetical protein
MSQAGQNLSVTNDYWFAPNIGLVKQAMKLQTLEVVGELTKYTLAK